MDLLSLAWLTPLAAAAPAASSRARWLPAFAALPALAAALLVPVGERVEIPWLLLGTVLCLDETGRIFLAFTAILWFAAGLYAAADMGAGRNAGRFRVFFLLAMAGNFGAIVAQDLGSFYAGFSVMGLASYGLVIHEGNRRALRAGKVYLVMTLLSELALFVAFALIADHVGGLAPERADLVGLGDLAIGFLLLGLAIKAGLVPVHLWLPLAHPAAPVPASAVLSGAMIKVALLGWLRFLPVGAAALPEWGLFLVFMGLVTVFFALPVGLVQSDPKVLLAYSSVSKIGLMALALGLMLLEPSLASAGMPALALYAAHHALAKGGLFLGVGLRHHALAQGLTLFGITLLALALAGVPFSAGAVAKYGIKPLLEGQGWTWLGVALALTTAGTGLLMARLLWVIWRTEPHPVPGYWPGGLAMAGLIVLSIAFSFTLGGPGAWVTDALPTGVAAAVGALFALVASRRTRLLRPLVDLVRPGDLLGLVRPVLAVLAYALAAGLRWWIRAVERAGQRLAATPAPPPPDPERGLRNWPNAGVAWLLITALLIALPLWSLQDFGGSPLIAQVPPPAGEPLPPDVPQAGERVAEGVGSIAAPPVAEPPGADGDERAQPLEAAGPETAAIPEKTEPPAPLPGEPMADEASRMSEAPPLPAGGGAAGTEARSGEPERVATAPAEPASLAPLATPPVQTPAPPSARVPAASGTDGPDRDDAQVCDPDRTFVFAHPEAAQPLRLSPCIRGPAGPERLAAPPLTNRLVELVQRHLRDLDYDPGPVDGLIGPRTRAAIRRFQVDRGDTATGAIDFDLLEALVAAGASDGDPARRRHGR